MSFGFQVFDENGEPALDDKAFSIIGREAALSGSGSFPIGDEFVALGVSGEALVGKDLLWYVGGGRVYYDILNGAVLDVIIFEDSIKSTANPTVGLEIFSESGVKSFSSGDSHFEVISQTPVNNYLHYSGPHSEVLNRETIYILHSLRHTAIGKTPQPLGTTVGLDTLSANSQTLFVKTRLLHFYQGGFPYDLSQIMASTPSSQLLRVRAK